MLSGSLNVEERNGVDVRDGRGGSEARNPRAIEEKYVIADDWQGRQGGYHTGIK